MRKGRNCTPVWEWKYVASSRRRLQGHVNCTCVCQSRGVLYYVHSFSCLCASRWGSTSIAMDGGKESRPRWFHNQTSTMYNRAKTAAKFTRFCVQMHGSSRKRASEKSPSTRTHHAPKRTQGRTWEEGGGYPSWSEERMSEMVGGVMNTVQDEMSPSQCSGKFC